MNALVRAHQCWSSSYNGDIGRNGITLVLRRHESLLQVSIQ